MAQDLWLAHHQILSINFLKDFIELNISSDTMIKNMKHVKHLKHLSWWIYGYWEKFNETSLPEKKDFYSHWNMENISDADYAHWKRVWKEFEIKKLWEYHDLYVQRNALFLADVFENFRNMCFEI